MAEFTDSDIKALVVISDDLMDHARAKGGTPETAGIAALMLFTRLCVANGVGPMQLANEVIPKLAQGAIDNPIPFEAEST